MASCCRLEKLLNLETSKQIEIDDTCYRRLYYSRYVVFALVILIIVLVNQGYQVKDSVISSVHVKVKGVAQTGKRIWDTAEYTIPGQGVNSFFVLTNIITTENQTQGLCPEFPLDNTVCITNKNCKEGLVDPQGNGIQTGKCVKYNSTINTCEVSAWCPVESAKAPPTPAILDSAEDFTVLIKNNVHFPKFDFTTRNIPPEFNISCIYNKDKAPLCPIFRLGDILKEAGQNFSEVAVQGGIIGIEINWDCNLNPSDYHCSPEYSFRRLDDKRTNETGYNFRFARHYKQPGGNDERTLIKAYGIRFDILIFGTAAKFDFFALMLYIGSCLAYFGVAEFVMNCSLPSSVCCSCFNCAPVKDYYRNKKVQKVLAPRCFAKTVLYVTFVEEPHILMIDRLSGTSLQTNESRVIYKGQGDFLESFQFPYQQQIISPQNQEMLRLLENPESNGSSSNEHDCPSWCRCGKCQETSYFWEQLCCRKTDGACITTSSLFEQLVLSRRMLLFVLLYKDPFLNLNGDGVANRAFRHCAYERYIRWRFGEGDLSDRAVIPNCCRKRIREAFPSKNQYSGYEKQIRK